MTHLIDTDSDLMHLYLDDVYLAQVPYDGAQIGGVNFYAAGDGVNIPTYYLDDVLVDITDPVVDNVQVVTALDCTFGPNPAQDFVRVQANLDNALCVCLPWMARSSWKASQRPHGWCTVEPRFGQRHLPSRTHNGSQRMTQRL